MSLENKLRKVKTLLATSLAAASLYLGGCQSLDSSVLKSSETETKRHIDEFIDWAQERDIKLIGTNKTHDKFVKEGLVLEEQISIYEIPNVEIVGKIMRDIPEHLMEVMYGHSVYMSTKEDKSCAITSPRSVIPLNEGMALFQDFDTSTAHEFFHIAQDHGIMGASRNANNLFSHLKEETEELFNVSFSSVRPPSPIPPGFINYYSTTNDKKNPAANSKENFAEHGEGFMINP